MQISPMLKDDLVTTAGLAKLPITEAELDAAAPAFEAMLDYFSLMSRLDVDSLEPTVHALSQENRLRADSPEASTLADALVESAPEREDRLIVIPNVL